MHEWTNAELLMQVESCVCVCGVWSVCVWGVCWVCVGCLWGVCGVCVCGVECVVWSVCVWGVCVCLCVGCLWGVCVWCLLGVCVVSVCGVFVGVCVRVLLERMIMRGSDRSLTALIRVCIRLSDPTGFTADLTDLQMELIVFGILLSVTFSAVQGNNDDYCK